MNEKVTFGVAALLLSAGLSAQPVINSSDFYPSVGNTFTNYSSSYTDPGSAGNNVTWDLSGMTNSGSSASMVSAANSGFPGTNVTVGDLSAQSYINMASDGWYTHGINANSTIITYQDPMRTNLFPMSMNATYSDYFHATFTNGIAFERFGDIMGEVDGYGTLITPEGTFEDVLRVHYIQDYKDSSDFVELNYYVEVYGWYKAGFHTELASVSTLMSDFGSSEYGFYLEATSLGLTKEEKAMVSVFPNPATDQIKIHVGNTALFENILVTDLNGRNFELNYTQENEAVRANIEKLEAGVYLATINYSNGSSVQEKFVVR